MGQTQNKKGRHSSPAATYAFTRPEPHPPAIASLWGLPTVVMAVLLMLLAVAAFSGCLGNDFVTWDDHGNFVENPYYRGLSWLQIRWDWTSFRLGVYQPLAWMLLGAEYLVWGIKPWGYHLTSLVLYAIDTVILFVLTVALLDRCRPGVDPAGRWAAVFAAGLSVALFSVHPLRTEVVAWASCQPYLPCALFSMLAVLAYLRAFRDAPGPRWDWLVGSFLLATAALLSKAVAVSLPVVLLILDVYPLGRLGGGFGRWFGPSARKVWLEKVPFAALSLLFTALAVVGRVDTRHPGSDQHGGMSARIAQACYGIWFYPAKTFLPLNLTAYYPLPERLVWFELPFLLCILATAGVSIALVLLRRRWPALLAVWLTYLAILAPNLGLIRIGDQITSDRYSYIAMFGVVALAAAGLCSLCPLAQRVRPVAVGLMVCSLGLLLGLIFLSRDQCRTWRTTEALWTHVLSHGGSSNHAAHSLLAGELFRQGRLEEAESHHAAAMKYSVGSIGTPYLAQNLNLLGVIRLKQGRLDEAGAQFVAAIRLNPNDPEPHRNLGLTLFQQGQLEEGGAQFVAAIRLNPNDPEPHNNLGLILFRQGRLEEAEAQHAESLKYSVGPVETHYKLLGAIRLKQGRLEEAAAQLGAAIRLNPNNPETHSNLGVTLFRQGRLEEARAEHLEALRLAPNVASAHYNLAQTLFQQARLDDARAQLAEALRLDPNNDNPQKAQKLVLSRQKQCEAAVTQHSQAVRVNPNDPNGHYHLAVALLQLGRFEEARDHYSQAFRLASNPVALHKNLGDLLRQFGRIDEALAQYAEIVHLDPDNVEAENCRAMLWATYPKAKYRDGRRAVASATRVCELTGWKKSGVLDTLAAASAEAGDFESAVKWQTRAIELLPGKQRAADLRSRLELYRHKQPYREPTQRR